MKILDCTLRDGGYCNGWQWSEDVLKNIVESLYGKVDIIEIGYRRPGKKGFEYCDDHYIHRLLEKEYDNLALMIDCKEYLKDNVVWEKLLQYHFCVDASETPITYIRCACTIDEIGQAIKVTKYLSSLGYKTTINIMKASILTIEQWNSINAFIYNETFDYLSYLYFADSFGSSFSGNIIDNLWWEDDSGKYMPVKIGIHPHNNNGMAFSHCKTSMAEIIDSSIAGLGRGAGNLDTLQVLMDRDGHLDYQLYKCLKVIERIKEKAQCGYCYEYHYCAVNNIHPNYAVYLKGLHKYGRYDIIKKLSGIPKNKRESFDKEVLCERYIV